MAQMQLPAWSILSERRFRGAESFGKGQTAQPRRSEYGASVTLGGAFGGDRGHLVVALDYTQRDQVRGERSWPHAWRDCLPSVAISPMSQAGGLFFHSAGLSRRHLKRPISLAIPAYRALKRFNVAAFLKYKLTDNIELYGRAMYTNARTEDRYARTTPQASARSLA